MSYLFVVAIGAIGGWLAAQYVTDSDHRTELDVVVGAVGSLLAVFLVRAAGPLSARGFLVSILVAVVGMVVSIYGMRQFMKARQASAPPVRRRKAPHVR